jgi:hypothetical protein
LALPGKARRIGSVSPPRSRSINCRDLTLSESPAYVLNASYRPGMVLLPHDAAPLFHFIGSAVFFGE